MRYHGTALQRDYNLIIAIACGLAGGVLLALAI